jgi:glutathione S-transferase
VSRILYDAAGCWKCDDVRQVLDRLGLAYESVEVRGNPEARARMIELTGDRYVPVLVDGDLAIWDRRRIIRHLLDAYADGADDALAEEVPPWAGGTRRVSPPPPPRPAPRTPGRR